MYYKQNKNLFKIWFEWVQHFDQENFKVLADHISLLWTLRLQWLCVLCLLAKFAAKQNKIIDTLKHFNIYTKKIFETYCKSWL